ncbi:MAG: hypothetical protein R3F37_07120 [Candidatus Competibacteraceae bacterium]
MTEQIVVTTIAICAVVILGMAFTYLMLFAVTLDWLAPYSETSWSRSGRLLYKVRLDGKIT